MIRNDSFGHLGIKTILFLFSVAITTDYLYGSDWPQFHYDAQHTGATPDVCKPPLTLKWKLKMPASLGGIRSPIIVKDRVYIGCLNYLSCLNKFTGTVIWRKTLSSNTGTPCSDGCNIYEDTAFEPTLTLPTLFSMDAYSGNVNWSDYPNGGYTPGTYNNNSIYIPLNHGTDVSNIKAAWVYAIDASTGARLWRVGYADSAGGATTPALYNNKVYTYIDNAWITQGDFKMVALNQSDGSIVWSYDIPEKWRSLSITPVGYGMVFFAVDWSVYAFNAENGSIVWKRSDFPSRMDISAPAVDDGKIFIGSGTTLDRKFYCLDAYTGLTVWATDLGDAIWSSPAISAGVVYVGTNSNIVYAMDCKDGRILWQYDLGHIFGGCAICSPAISGNMLYICSEDSTVYAFQGVGVADSLPKGIYARCYPNPFAQAINISYQTRTADYFYLHPGTVNISMRIYNLAGQLVRTLCENEVITSGAHVKVWDGKNNQGRDVANGVYLCRLTSDLLPQALIKMVKIK